MKIYADIVTADQAIKKGGLIRAGYLHTKLATQLARADYLKVLYPNMPPQELLTLANRMVAAFKRGQLAQEMLYQLGYPREIPKGVRE